MTLRLVFATALLAATLPAFAQDAPAPVADAKAATTAAAPAAREPDSVDRLCLRETGTLIRSRRAQASRERCPSHVYGRVWTQDDLRSTGQMDIAQALRMLDPSIR